MKNDLSYFLSLEYPVVVVTDEEVGAVVASIPDLPGCITQGDSMSEALELIQEAKKLWLEVALEYGDTIPEPIDKEYSGKTSIRMPRTLHKTLVEQAGREGVSLNQYMVLVLQRGSMMVELKTDVRREMERGIGSAMNRFSIDLYEMETESGQWAIVANEAQTVTEN